MLRYVLRNNEIMSNPDSPESEERMIDDTPDVPIWDDTQEREAHERLEALRPIVSTLGPFPTEADTLALTNHTGDRALEAMDTALADLEPNRLQLAHYVQRDNIFPTAGGLDIASDDGINAAFKIVQQHSLPVSVDQDMSGHMSCTPRTGSTEQSS